MGEIAINPIHNVHKKYRTMNLVNPYIFAPPVDLSTNTEIGGVAATINTPALLATRLGIDVSRITNFTIVGSDIKCRITGGYIIPTTPGFGNVTSLTYYRDTDALVTIIKNSAFYNTGLSEEVRFDNCTIIEGGALSKNFSTGFYLPKVTTVGDICFDNVSTANYYYLPLCTSLGSTNGNDFVFRNIKSGAIIYVNPSLATNNAGSQDGDLSAAITSGAVVRYVSNFTAPNPVTDLSAGTVYNTAIQLNFTPPSSTNAIDYYECYVNGVLKNTITASGQYIIGLTPNTFYNITLKAVDIFYNKSIVSNTVSQSTNGVNPAVPTTGLVSYYKLDETTGTTATDSFGANNGTNTSITLGTAGKLGNAYSFNGTTGYVSLGNPTAFQISTGAISVWVKTAGAGASYRGIVVKQLAYSIFAIDNIIGFYSWGSPAGNKVTTFNVSDNQWHHIVLNFGVGTNNTTLYIDGVMKLKTTNGVSAQTAAMTIGSGGGSSQLFSGLIDETSIYSRNLTSNEILLMYNSGTGITL